MKKFFNIAKDIVMVSLIIITIGCEKERVNDKQNESVCHATLNTFYDDVLLNQFMQTPVFMQFQTVVNSLNIGVTQGILSFTSSEHVNKTYDTLVYFSNFLDSLMSSDIAYMKYDTSNSFPVMPILYAFEHILDFQSLYSHIEEQLLYMESGDGIALNNDPDTHFIESPYMRALLTTDCELIIGDYIYLYGDSLHIKIPDLDFCKLQAAKSLITQNGELNGMRMACEMNYAIQTQHENDDDEPEICVKVNQDGSYVFYVKSEFEVLTCMWNFDDGGTSTLKMPTHVFNSHGNYQISVSVLIENNSQPVQLTKNIKVGTCSVYITNWTLGEGEYTFTANPYSESEYPVEYTWKIDGTVMEYANSSVTYNFSLNGYKKVVVKVRFSNGCIAKDSMLIKVRGTGDCCRGNDREKEKNISYCDNDKRLKHVFAVRNVFPFHRFIVRSVNYKKKNNGKYKREKASSLSVYYSGTIYDKNCDNQRHISHQTKTKSNAKEVCLDYGTGGDAFRVSRNSVCSFYGVTNSGCESLNDVAGLFLHDKKHCQ